MNERKVLQDVIKCAKTWAPCARIIGNIKAKDIIAACELGLLHIPTKVKKPDKKLYVPDIYMPT
jgi:hypothetical protein